MDIEIYSFYYYYYIITIIVIIIFKIFTHVQRISMNVKHMSHANCNMSLLIVCSPRGQREALAAFV